MDSPKSQETEVVFVNVGTVPCRTKIAAEGILYLRPTNGRQVVNLAAVPKRYTCQDCGWSTGVVARMEEHQANHTKYHTLGQRWRRFWSLLKGFLKPNKLKGQVLIEPVHDE